MKISIKWFLIMVGLCVPASPLTMAQRAELATAIARGPLNMVSLYAEARHKPGARDLKIAAQVARITNDLLSIVNHENKFKIDYFHSQQIARIIQSSISLLNTVRSEESEVDFSLFRELLIDSLYVIETVSAGMTPSEMNKGTMIAIYLYLQSIASLVQGCGDLLRDQDWQMEAVDGGLILASFINFGVAGGSAGMAAYKWAQDEMKNQEQAFHEDARNKHERAWRERAASMRSESDSMFDGVRVSHDQFDRIFEDVRVF